MRRLSILLLLIPCPTLAQPPANTGPYVKEHYTRATARIPMRDGVRLYTIIYAPKDLGQRYPILLTRTPYGIHPYEEGLHRNSLGPSPHFLAEKFIFVYQDVRGRMMSEGEFENVRPQRGKDAGPKVIDESTDAYDTIDWLVKNVQNNNGKVGMWGISYPGFYTSAGMINAHPALKAASPQAPIADWYFDDFFHNGAFFLNHAFHFFSAFGKPRPQPTTTRIQGFSYPTPDGYKFFLEAGPLSHVESRYFKGQVAYWNTMAQHPNYDDFWKARNLLPHLKNVAPAVMTVGGLYDAEDLYGTFNTYQAIEKQNPGVFNILVVGPWSHGGWTKPNEDRLGAIVFGQTVPTYQKDIELAFFNHFLKAKGPHSFHEALVFETGANRWRGFDAWPPRERKPGRFFFNVNGNLTAEPPGQEGHRGFLSDPRKPVPFMDQFTTQMAKEYMVEDQRFAWRRPDVLSFQTEPLTHDLTLAGPVAAHLLVSTSGTDADWVVKLIDVYPDSDNESFNGRPMAGYQMLVRSEVIRGRFRNGFEKPEPFKPQEPTVVRIELLDILHTFRPGHRLMVQISSSYFPLVDRNPQKFVPNIFLAEENDFQSAAHRVYVGEKGSRIDFGILPAARRP